MTLSLGIGIDESDVLLDAVILFPVRKMLRISSEAFQKTPLLPASSVRTSKRTEATLAASHSKSSSPINRYG